MGHAAGRWRSNEGINLLQDYERNLLVIIKEGGQLQRHTRYFFALMTQYWTHLFEMPAYA